MPTKITSTPAAAGLIVVLTLIGCTTALAITGHISGDAALAAILSTGTGAAGIFGAHVGGNTAVNAAAASPAATGPAPAAVGPVAPSPGPTAADVTPPPPAASEPVQAVV